MPFTVTVPTPPSTNALFVTYRERGGVARAKTKEYKAWIKTAGQLLNIQRPVPVKGRVAVTIFAERNNRRDLDNHLKGLLDLIVGHALIEDDRKVERIVAAWHDAPDCIVTVEEIAA